uniref:Uncharacterized protein n=1 Tax=Anopheles melas TaxID=34690 RepID=A0A182TVH0_9DIPT
MGQGLEPSTADLFLFSRSQPPQLPSRTDFFERSKKQAHTRDNSIGSSSSSERGSGNDNGTSSDDVRFALTSSSTDTPAAAHHARWQRWPALSHHHHHHHYYYYYYHYYSYLPQYIGAIGARGGCQFSTNARNNGVWLEKERRQ